LYDNVYFILKDIFTNCKSYRVIIICEFYNNELTNGLYFEEWT